MFLLSVGMRFSRVHSVKLFAHQELRHLNRIFTHIRHGGVAVVEGQWEQITAVMDYIQRHKQGVDRSRFASACETTRPEGFAWKISETGLGRSVAAADVLGRC